MFIDCDYIEKLLQKVKASPDNGGQNPRIIDEILDKAEEFKGLSHEEVAMLLLCDDKKYINRIFQIAEKIKSHIYGNRVVMFAPLYVSDYCVNQCTYCNYNLLHKFKRNKLTQDQVRQEVEILEKMGHKRLALEAGEDDENCPIDYILECLNTIYNMKNDNNEIRRVNVNIAATTVENYQKLKKAGIGTYILFQETYHKPTYEKVHLKGPKSNYEYHTTAFDRAMKAGVDDVGGGVLFGLYDPIFEVIGLMLHNEHLEQTYGVGFHTVSVPRICKADGAINTDIKNGVSDDTFLKITAVLRLAIPFTGIIISTRESEKMRKKLIHIGASQVSGGSSTGVGGYSLKNSVDNEAGTAQFEINDDRNTQDIVKWLLDEKLIPSFCTACYRSGRTGDRFMALAKSGDIKNVCTPNALMTLCEYAQDYGDDDLKNKAYFVIDEEIDNISNEKIRELTASNVEKIKKGERDLYI